MADESTGRVYWYNRKTRQSQWTAPKAGETVLFGRDLRSYLTSGNIHVVQMIHSRKSFTYCLFAVSHGIILTLLPVPGHPVQSWVVQARCRCPGTDGLLHTGVVKSVDIERSLVLVSFDPTITGADLSSAPQVTVMSVCMLPERPAGKLTRRGLWAAPSYSRRKVVSLLSYIPSYTRADVSTWSISDVSTWLSDLGLACVPAIPLLERNFVDGPALLSLDAVRDRNGVNEYKSRLLQFISIILCLSSHLRAPFKLPDWSYLSPSWWRR